VRQQHGRHVLHEAALARMKRDLGHEERLALARVLEHQRQLLAAAHVERAAEAAGRRELRQRRARVERVRRRALVVASVGLRQRLAARATEQILDRHVVPPLHSQSRAPTIEKASVRDAARAV